MDDLSNHIPYRKAKQQLDARFNTTDDEIAMWVSGIDEGGLNAYIIDPFRKLSLFTFESRYFINNDDYISTLEGLYFVPEDIEYFQPIRRYLSRKVLTERWIKPCENRDSAINFIEHRAKDSGLFEYHPIVGFVESTGDLFRSGLFSLDDVLHIESKYFPELTKAIDENDCTSINSAGTIPTLEYDEPELLLDDAVDLYRALKLLGNDWTAQELALQVFYGGIRVFEKSNNNTHSMLRPVANSPDYLKHYGDSESFSGELVSISSVLLQFKYSKPELSLFKPDYRYISYQQAVTRISELIGNIEDTEEFLIYAIKQQTIFAFHPFVGRVTPEHSMNGERWRNGYFEEWKLNKLLSANFDETETLKCKTEELDGMSSQDGIEPTGLKNTKKTQRTRKTNLRLAVDAAIATFRRKPSFDELWKFFQDDKDETGFILDFTNTHITWIDTKGRIHDTQKESVANQLSRVKS